MCTKTSAALGSARMPVVVAVELIILTYYLETLMVMRAASDLLFGRAASEFIKTRKGSYNIRKDSNVLG